MIIKKKVRKVVSFLLMFAMMSAMAGCGGNDSGRRSSVSIQSDQESSGGADVGAGRADSEDAGNDGSIAMGRYVEEEIDLSEQLGNPMDLCIRDDGSLVILDESVGMLVSRDQGATWAKEPQEWFDTAKKEKGYISGMYMASDGTVAVFKYRDDTAPEEPATSLALILPDGTKVPVEVSLTEDEDYFRQAAMGNDGRIIASTLRSIYEIQKDGSARKILTLDYSPSWIWVRDDLLFMDSDWDEANMPAIYDMKAGAYVEDEVFAEFVNDNYDRRTYNGTYYGSMHLLPGEDGTVYVAGEKGIHRHVIGGNMMEQIVDGNLSLLCNPDYNIVDMVQLENDVFLALFANRKLIRFTYDPNIPAMPENMLTIYSLKENGIIRQAISFYQTMHPDVFVSYRIGMGDNDSVTREDALKKLNTEIMAGTGPDLLVLDELPFDSYVDKGMLLDLTDYLEEYSLQEPLFDNVIEALKCNGRAYMVPATVGVPRIAFVTDDADNMTTLSEFGAAVEKLRQEYPTEDIIAVSDGRGIMKRFAGTSEPDWVTEQGTIDKDVIGEYLEQCKRIFDAQMDGLDEKKLDDYNERNERLMKYYAVGMDGMDWEVYNDVMEYVGGEQHAMAGWTCSVYSSLEILSLNKTKGFENTKVMPMQGQCSQVFKPMTMLGVSAASGQTEEALRFMDVFLSAKVQSVYDGFPLNQEAYDIQFTPEQVGEGGVYSSMASSNGDGRTIEYVVYWPSDEEIAAFKKEIASVGTAYIPDRELEDAVFTQGAKYMSGECSLEEALNEIEKKVSIYMAE